MRVWTVHLPPLPDAETAGRRERRRGPVLVREGFSVGAFLFGPLWLLLHGLWLATLVWLLLAVAAVLLLPAGALSAAFLAAQFLLGCHARDLRRRALARRGYAQAHVVVERDEERAMARLLGAQPELAAAWGRAALA